MAPTPDLYPIPFPTLVDRLDRELRQGGPVYGLKPREIWTPDPDRDLGCEHLGRRLGTPAGPASGPHTQLAQNLVLSYLGGGRFHELKTVQVDDELVIPRPCIHVPHVGYNVEWSQELRVPQSALEYVKGWYLVHGLVALSGLWKAPDVTFDVSIGYDLAGVQSDKVRGYLAAMADASALIAGLREEVRDRWPAWADVEVPARVSDSITISTFHGCPAGEIEAIASQCLDWGWNTVVKLNPTLHGHDLCRQLLDTMGYSGVRLNPEDFEKDLQWSQLEAFIPRLKARAADAGLGFGVKFTNTLVCRHEEPPFEDGEMYLSGPPLHVLATKLAARFREAFPGLPITFSAGVEASNFPACVRSGLAAVTSCSDLLKGGGYGRMTKYLRALEKDMAAAGASDLASYRSGSGTAFLKARALDLECDPAWHRDVQKAPRKVGTDLVLLDCLTCDKCIPVCPNGANFAFDVPKGTWNPGRLSWTGGDFQRSEGQPLVADKRHQIGNVADACNLCGQCDPWCPEDGGPYLVKPTLFLSAESWSDHPDREGFLVAPDRHWIRWRRPGLELCFARTPDGGARLETETGTIWLRDDIPERTEGTGSLDLRDAVTLRLLLEGFDAAGSGIWLPPA